MDISSIIRLVSESDHQQLLSFLNTHLGNDQQRLFAKSFYMTFFKTDDPYPITHEDAIPWLGYERKDFFKRAVEKNLILNDDYIVLTKDQVLPQGGRPTEIIKLTVNGFKKLGMLAKTEHGNAIRLYYIELEKHLMTYGMAQVIKQNQEKDEIIQERERENETLKRQLIQATTEDRTTPIVYIWIKDERKTGNDMQIKIGVSSKKSDRFKPFRQVDPYGTVFETYSIYENGMVTTEKFVNQLISQYKAGGEVFNVSAEIAKPWVVAPVMLMNLSKDPREDKQTVIQKIVDYMTQIIKDVPNPLSGKVSIETQTDECHDVPSMHHQGKSDLHTQIDAFIAEKCNVGPTYEVSSKDLEGAFRLWYRRPGRDIHEGFLEYARTVFQPTRLTIQNDEHVVNGFRGVCLNPTEYKPSVNPCDVEVFLFQECVFAPSAKVLTKDLLEAFQKWTTRLSRESITRKCSEKALKDFLKDYQYVLPSTIWTSNGNGLGYYGIGLKSNEPQRKSSSTAKPVFKKNAETHDTVNTWPTVAKAATAEKMPAAKMSRIIKNAVIVDDHYYTT
jgi:phage anti-repressor protein